MRPIRWFETPRGGRYRCAAGVLAMTALLTLLPGIQNEAWARKPAGSKWPAVLRGGMYLKLAKLKEREFAGERRVEKYEDIAALQNVVCYLASYSDPVSYDTWGYALPGGGVPQTGKMAIEKLVQYEAHFLRYGEPCSQIYKLEASEEDEAIPTTGRAAVLLLEEQLSANVWKVFARVSVPMVATETFTQTCGDSWGPNYNNVYLDAKVEGTLTRVGKGKRVSFVLSGERTYEEPGGLIVTESLQGTLLPVATPRRR